MNDQLLDTNVWIYADGRLLERPSVTASPGGRLSAVAADMAGAGSERCATADGGLPVRLCSLPVPGAHAAVIVTALSLGPYRGSADALLKASLVLDAVMLACTYVLTRLAVGRALRPVRSMTAQATHWYAVGSEERYGAAHHPVELARLGGSLDVLLDRIRSVLRHERQLTGELPHELRTPPTRMVVELDWWRARPRSAAETWATVTVSARRTADGVRVEVTDDGPGVPGDFVGELFTPGRRADGDDGHDGAGMGLPLARRLARSVGGEVSFDSGCTRGARFTITLAAH